MCILASAGVHPNVCSFRRYNRPPHTNFQKEKENKRQRGGQRHHWMYTTNGTYQNDISKDINSGEDEKFC